ncbi:hypothetical protein CBW65_02840 [Tumebacillus avium]|uniref:PhnB-like domain-containing protein n=1 Tax=Tumebacillus avium TaxID=1903704 RepID=A0A1Y0IWP4_9BACL|nr:VOC family protein [Tumebacillus avium]ARU63763.1 hypothetical protein CBW65_02840 [Tumebacillus avium]
MATKLIPYLVLDGTAKEAIEYYQKALDAELLFSQAFGDSPEDPEHPTPAEMKDRIMHATIKVGESEIMFSDTFPGQPHAIGSQVTICLTTDSKETAERFFNALADGGQVSMPLQETFFSPLYGIVTDKFGIPFQIYTEGQH